MFPGFLSIRLITETDAHRAGGGRETAIERHGTELPSGIAERHAGDLSRGERHHAAKLLLGDQLDGLRAKRSTQCPVHIRRAAAALKMPQDDAAGFLHCSLLNFLSDASADAAEASFSILRLIGGSHEVGSGGPRALGDNHNAELF